MKIGKILGVGSPLLDILVRVDDAFLETVPGEKGGMVMVEAAYQESVLERLPVEPELVPGGSTGNTIFALARLGVPAAMLGKIGRDENGAFYRERFRELGGDDSFFIESETDPNGTCLSMITPDAERTMRTAMGAAITMTMDDVLESDFSGCDFVFIEGYMLYAPTFDIIIGKAKEAGCRVGIDLSSFEVVRDFKERLPELLKNDIDLVMGNEEEVTELLGALPVEKQLETLASWCEIAAIKLGRKGSIARSGNEVARVPAELVEKPTDTTAAGDLWATGFLYGLYQGKSLREAAYYGALTSSEVVKVVGSEIPDERWNYIKEKFENGLQG